MTGPHAGLLRQVAADAADPDLVARFARHRDEAAFAELVRRHGPLVLGVCRRVVGHRETAEDAFQAVFLVLARKASAVRRPEALAAYLYGVAYRVARRARRAAARRRRREVQVPDMPHPEVPPAGWTDLSAVIDEELSRLPEWYRSAVVLCDLQGLAREEAATRLGVPVGTVSSRLHAGRKRLADRLGRRGVTAPAAGQAVALGSADVSAELVRRAVASAVAGVTGGAVPATVESLTHGGGATMGKVFGFVAATAAVVGLAVGGASAWPDAKPADPPAKAAKADPKKPEPPAAEKKAGGKAKLVKTVELNGRSGPPVWSPDGTLLAVREGNGMHVLDSRTLTDRMTIDVTAATTVVGFTPANALVTYAHGPRRINAVAQLRVWVPPVNPSVGRDEPDQAIEIDPADGTPVRLLPDNKAVLVVAHDRKPAVDGGQSYVATRFRVVESADGGAVRDVVRVAGYAVGYAVTPDGKRLVVASYPDDGGLAVECVTVADGKRVWVKAYERAVAAGTMANVVQVSPDGSGVAVTWFTPSSRPQAGGFGGGPGGGMAGGRDAAGAIDVLDAATGADRVTLGGRADGSWAGMGFSHDGRLFVTGAYGSAESQLRIWDVRTGKPVKTWDGTAEAAFAPDRPVLAVVETYTERGGAREGERRVSPVYRATLGMWDVSGLMK